MCARSKGDLTGPSPVDRGKPGSKIHAIGEHAGLPIQVNVSAANDRRMLEDMVDGVQPVANPPPARGNDRSSRRGTRGYDYPERRDLLHERNITPRIAARASSRRSGSAGTATSSNAAWNGPPGSGVWPAATSARLPTSSDTCAWHAP